MITGAFWSHGSCFKVFSATLLTFLFFLSSSSLAFCTSWKWFIKHHHQLGKSFWTFNTGINLFRKDILKNYALWHRVIHCTCVMSFSEACGNWRYSYFSWLECKSNIHIIHPHLVNVTSNSLLFPTCTPERRKAHEVQQYLV